MTEAGEIEERLREAADQHARKVTTWGVWVGVDKPGTRLPSQGWKIHVSARPANLRATVEAILPVLLRTSCSFKVIRSEEQLRELNSSFLEPGNIGKAVTVYPEDPERFAEVADQLASVLTGFQGPRINSDQRLRPDAPVYYRYGPFTPVLELNDSGSFTVIVRDPNGSTHPGAAGATYWQPDWLADPFACGSAQDPQDPQQPVVVGGRYRITRGIQRSAKGAVYRAIDLSSGASVIMKEARAFIDEDADGHDARVRLRHQRAILVALADLEGTPDFVDHFRHGDDEFLVMTSVGTTNLSRSVGESGVYRAGEDAGDRSLETLAGQLVSLLDAIHARGVVVRDFTPANLVLAEDGGIRFVDFEVSRHDGLQFFGWTPGFCPLSQRDNKPATVADDYYSLGATLFYAATGRDPSFVPGGPTHDLERLQVGLEASHGRRTGILGLIPLLLQQDPLGRAEVVDRIRRGDHTRTPAEDKLLDGAAKVFSTAPDRLDSIIRHSVAEVARHAKRLMQPGTLPREVFSSPSNVYYGSAGMGMELLQHSAGDQELGALVTDLAYWTLDVLSGHRAAAGLMFGGTGTAVFVTAAGVAAADDELVERGRRLDAEADSEQSEFDYTHGHAGRILADVRLWRLTGAGSYLDRAKRTAELLTGSDHLAELRRQPPDYLDQPAVASTMGFAHGISGHAFALLALSEATGDHALLETYFDTLALRVAEFAEVSRRNWLNQMSASWCQGLAGMGAALVRGALTLGRTDLIPVLDQAAEVCVAATPRMLVTSQCCGLAGVGEFLLDMAVHSGQPSYFAQAETVFRLILARSGGQPWAPEFPDQTRISSSGGWSAGTAGMLSFARRLRDRTPHRLWLDDSVSRSELQATGSSAPQHFPGQVATAG